MSKSKRRKQKKMLAVKATSHAVDINIGTGRSPAEWRPSLQPYPPGNPRKQYGWRPEVIFKEDFNKIVELEKRVEDLLNPNHPDTDEVLTNKHVCKLCNSYGGSYCIGTGIPKEPVPLGAGVYQGAKELFFLQKDGSYVNPSTGQLFCQRVQDELDIHGNAYVEVLPESHDLQAAGNLPAVQDQGDLGASTAFGASSGVNFTAKNNYPISESRLFKYFNQRKLGIGDIPIAHMSLSDYPGPHQINSSFLNDRLERFDTVFSQDTINLAERPVAKTIPFKRVLAKTHCRGNAHYRGFPEGDDSTICPLCNEEVFCTVVNYKPWDFDSAPEDLHAVAFWDLEPGDYLKNGKGWLLCTGPSTKNKSEGPIGFKAAEKRTGSQTPMLDMVEKLEREKGNGEK